MNINMKNYTYSVYIILLLVFINACSGGRRSTEITQDELTKHIRYLTSDELAGRLTGTDGDSLAAEYIRKELTSYGLQPLTADGFQRFKVVDRIVAGEQNSFVVNGTKYNLESDFLPYSFSENGNLSAEVVFAGYGFSIENDSLKWNDYNGIDVNGKWVLVLRADPEPDNIVSAFSQFSADRYKAAVAKDLGASGILLVSGEGFDRDDVFDPVSREAFSVGIPSFRISRSVADAILANKGRKINDLETKLNESREPASFPTGTVAEGTSDLEPYRSDTRNVVMYLPGEDSLLKSEYLVFGAHFDHLGMGGEGSSSRTPDTVGVHHGADDNASGVAMMIELAGKFAGTSGSHARTLVFMAFSGEEEGLLGSKYFTDNSPVDLSKVDIMLNFDMVGRLNEEKTLQVGGVGTAEGLSTLVNSFNDTTLLSLTLTQEGSGPSDHSAFYAKNIPVLFITTGAHTDYHTPTDTWEKINFDGMVSIADYIYDLASDLANDSSRLSYTEAGPSDDLGGRPRRRGVTLGIMPDFAGVIKNGLRADLVTPGKPAALGGMKKGDIIVSINGKPVNNIEDYMFRMSQMKRGERISVEVIRNDKKEVLIILL